MKWGKLSMLVLIPLGEGRVVTDALEIKLPGVNPILLLLVINNSLYTWVVSSKTSKGITDSSEVKSESVISSSFYSSFIGLVMISIYLWIHELRAKLMSLNFSNTFFILGIP